MLSPVTQTHTRPHKVLYIFWVTVTGALKISHRNGTHKVTKRYADHTLPDTLRHTRSSAITPSYVTPIPKDTHRHSQCTSGTLRPVRSCTQSSHRHTLTSALAAQPCRAEDRQAAGLPVATAHLEAREGAGETFHLQPAGDPPHPPWKPGPGS